MKIRSLTFCMLHSLGNGNIHCTSMRTWNTLCSGPIARRDCIVEEIDACCETRSASVVSYRSVLWVFTTAHNSSILQFFAEKNKKRDVRSNYYHEPTLARDGVDQRQHEIPTDVERGDIPIMHGDCEGRIWPYTLLFSTYQSQLSHKASRWHSSLLGRGSVLWQVFSGISTAFIFGWDGGLYKAFLLTYLSLRIDHRLKQLAFCVSQGT